MAALAPDRTTALAATLLSQAAAGAGSEDVHLLLTAIQGRAGSEPDAEAASLRLAGRGHTSGWDTLAGLLLGVHLLLRLGEAASDRRPERRTGLVRGAC